MNRAMLACLFCAALSAPLAAQQAQSDDGYDFDTLAACSIVYQRVGELYSEQGDENKASEFQETAYAYSASAFHMLKYQTTDQEGAYVYAEDRMKMVMDSLNDASTSSEGGDHEVIEQWLPYCDTMAQGVTVLLQRRDVDGW